MNDIKNKTDKLIKTFMGVGTLGVLILTVGIFAATFILLGSIAAAVGISIALGIGAIHFIPVWSMKCANWAVKMKTQEADDNPIETLINIINQMTKEKDDYKQMVVEKTAMVDGIAESVEQLRKTDPEGAAQSDEDIRLYRQEIAEHEIVLNAAVRDLAAAQDHLTRMKGRWKIAQMHTAYQKNNPKGQAAYMRQHLVDTAYLSIQTAANQSRAQLRANSVEAAAKREHHAQKNAPKQHALENQPTNVIDVTAITMKDKVL